MRCRWWGKDQYPCLHIKPSWEHLVVVAHLLIPQKHRKHLCSAPICLSKWYRGTNLYHGHMPTQPSWWNVPSTVHVQQTCTYKQKYTIKYLVTTRKDCIHCWWMMPVMVLKYLLLICATFLHGILPPNTTCPTHEKVGKHVYIDSDWATCQKTIHSHIGIIVRMTREVIAYKTKLHFKVAFSTMEAEFMAACDEGIFSIYLGYSVELRYSTSSGKHHAWDHDACPAMAMHKNLPQ